MRSLTCVLLLLTVFSLVAVSPAQQAPTTAVPNLINYSGTLALSSGVGMSAKTVGVRSPSTGRRTVVRPSGWRRRT